MSDCQVSLLVQPSGIDILVMSGKSRHCPRTFDEILASPCPFWPNKKINETHMLVFIPTGRLMENLFTLENLLNLVTNPKSGGHVAQCNFDWGWLQINHGKQPVKASYWVMMTKDVLPETRRKPFGNQVKLLESKAKRCTLFWWEKRRGSNSLGGSRLPSDGAPHYRH